VSGGVLRGSGEYVPVEAPQELIRALGEFRAEIAEAVEA
jgi:hypothetical protein